MAEACRWEIRSTGRATDHPLWAASSIGHHRPDRSGPPTDGEDQGDLRVDRQRPGRSRHRPRPAQAARTGSGRLHRGSNRWIADKTCSTRCWVVRYRPRQHLELTVAAIGRFGPDDAELVLRGAISSAARNAGLATKYHDTITRFWCRLVAHPVNDSGHDATVDDLLLIAPALADKHRMIFRSWTGPARTRPSSECRWP